ncbi:short-chain dehydrogenase [Pandoraea horticolens]|uniref:Short-chain dehydrogenase n=1 Tax=Pandoraea horticolens TaxID=2508298 RepID=A0A5E4XEA0_9BURK|nr:SDR family NAD(P)-dependent oxidoreductase [Pandoraea horticolens]VVE34761.1 short-chain dehydrogenase [Pandoraea horticolens]
MMNLQLTGKTAIVTGASRGIGLAIVRELVAQGMQVVGAARTLTDDLKKSGATPVSVDLTAADGPRRLIEQTQAKYGGLDLLVNNLGGGGDKEHPTTFLESTDAQWMEMFELNFFSTVRVTRAALPDLMARRGGIINFSSMCARIPHTGPLPYAASKGAINTFSKGLAEELGPQGVRVNTISPGAVLTEQWSGPDGFGAKLAAARGISLEQLLRDVPAELGATTGQFADPAHVASLVAYLASPLAAAIHGADYAINGGAIKTA